MIQEDEAEKENCIVQLPKAIDQSEVSPILLCQSDQPPLWIGFGCVQVGSTTVRQFTLVNPQKSAVEISATFNYNQNGITLAIGEPDNRTVILFPGKRIEATISWNPQRNYSLCDTIQIILQNGVILSISVHGLSGIGEQKKSVCRRVLKSIDNNCIQSSSKNVRQAVNAVDSLKLWCNSCISSTMDDTQKTAEYLQDIQILLHSPEISSILFRITQAIKSQRLMLRDDHDIRIHVGLKEDFIQLLLSYEPFRLQLVLDTVTKSTNGEIHERYDARRLIGSKILQSEEIRAFHCKPGVIMSRDAEQKYRRALDEHLLEKFFTTVILLDQIRLRMMCGNHLKLFVKGSQVKSTNEVLVTFCKKFLRSEKNIVKHLASFGFVPLFYQTPYDEFEFQVSNIDLDLRDGIRLIYLANSLSREKDQHDVVNPASLRVPAISRLQKLHNVAALLHSLQSKGIRVPFDEKCIVDGDSESTIFLLSLMRLEFEGNFIVSDDEIRAEICRIAELAEGERESILLNPTTPHETPSFRCRQLIYSWVRAIAAKKNMEVDFASNIADGAIFCILINYYIPDSIPSELLNLREKGHHLCRKRFAAVHDLCRAVRFPTLLPNLDSIRGWDEKMLVCFLGFLFSSLINYEEKERHKLKSISTQSFKEQNLPRPHKNKDTQTNSKGFNSNISKFVENHPTPEDLTLVRLQTKMQSEAHSRQIAEKKVAEMKSSYDESLRLVEEEKKLLELRLREELSDKIRLTKQYETDISDEIIRSAEESLWKEFQGIYKNSAAKIIQRNSRRILRRKAWATTIRATVLIQSKFRAWNIRNKIQRLRNAVTVLQRVCRMRKWREQQKRKQNLSARKIQTKYKIFCFTQGWKKFLSQIRTLKSAILTWTSRRSFVKMRHSAITVQRWIKNWFFSKQKRIISLLATKIQRMYRRFIVRKIWIQRDSAIKIQNGWRSSVMRKFMNNAATLSKKLHFFQQSRAAKMIQNCYRMHLKKKKELHAVQVIYRWYLSVLPIIRIKKIRRGICRLQAMRRSLKIRRNLSAEVKEVYCRVKIANQNSQMNPQLRLGNQTDEAISVLLKGKMISQVLPACQTLESSTHYSPKCCQRFIKSAASKVLFTLICSCNRSTSHQELLRCALCVLLNVTNDSNLTAELAHNGNTTELLVDLMQMFRDKSTIFNLSCELLMRLMKCQSPIKVECKASDMRKRLDGIFHILERKNRLDMRVKTINSTQTQNRKSPSSSEKITIGSSYSLMQQFMKILNDE